MRRLGILALALLLPASALADPKDDARRHFRSGLMAAESNQYEIALQHFLAAQEAYPHPATLYNIARSYTDLNDLQNALTYYRLYRDEMPEKAADVDPVISVIEARIGQSTTPVVAAAPVTSGGGGGGPTQVIVTGPTPEELARLQAIAAELEALSVAINERTVAEQEAARAAVAAAADGQGGATQPAVADGGAAGAAGTGIDGAAIPENPEDIADSLGLPEGGMMEDAYERIVVTASRYGQDPLDSPSTTSVLTAEDIRMTGATNLPDLLRRVVGVDVMSPSSSHSEVSIRGFNRELNNKVLILIDGRSTYMDFIGATFWAGLPIVMEEIERVEIIRGPGSAVYGANAMTGVINIITKTPGETQGNIVHVDGGTPGLARGTLVSSGRTGSSAWRLSAGYNQLGRWAKDYKLTDESSVIPMTEDQDRATQIMRANGRLDHTFGTKGFASLSAGMSSGSVEFYNIGALGDYRLDGTATYVRGDIAYDPVHLRVFWNRDDDAVAPWFESASVGRSLNSKLDSDVLDVELEAPLSFETGSIDHTLNVGLGYRYKRTRFSMLEGGFDSPINENHYDFFANEEAAYKRLKLVGSLRIDRHPLLPLSQTISPRAAAIVRVAKSTSARVTAGTAFRAPNMIENYMLFDLNSSADGVYIRDYGGVPLAREGLGKELAPERILTVEAGLHDESSDYHTADIAVYMNRVTDLIGLQSLVPGISFYDPASNGIEVGYSGWVNQDPTYTGVGVEAEAEVFPTDGMDFFANIDIQSITEQSAAGSIPDRATSALKINAGWDYRTPWRTDVSIAAHYVSPQVWRLREFDSAGQIVVNEAAIGSRVLTSARVGLRPLNDSPLEVSVTAWNFTALFSDGAREHPKGQPLLPRVYGSISYEF